MLAQKIDIVYISCHKNQKSNYNMSSCETLLSKFDFDLDGYSRGCPSNAAFEFVMRNCMEEPAYVAVGNIV